MAGIHTLFTCLDSIAPLSQPFNDYLIGAMQPAEYKKGSFLLREGTVCRNVWWLRKGFVRFYYRLGQQEISQCFISQNNMVLAISSLYQQGRSNQSIQAMEDCSTWLIDYPSLEYIYRHFPEAQVIGRKTAEQYYALLEKRLHAIALRKSVDRYHYLEEHFPELLQRVPLKYLASFIDLEVHTISRMRRKR